MTAIRTTRQVAQFLGVAEWRVRRLYEDGTLPEPEKFGGKRAIPAAQVPTIVSAMQKRGWLPDTVEAAP